MVSLNEFNKKLELIGWKLKYNGFGLNLINGDGDFSGWELNYPELGCRELHKSGVHLNLKYCKLRLLKNNLKRYNCLSITNKDNKDESKISIFINLYNHRNIQREE